MKLGIIDLGTNTFNILIAEIVDNRPFKNLLNTESAVMLGKESINEGYISDKAFERAFDVLKYYKQLIDEFKCDKIIAFGTSAIRSASNANDFINKVNSELDINIETISGEQEAEYIYHGVKQSMSFTDENYLILDIGGGSNEFIIANKNEFLWKHSFPLGAARLLERFSPEDPISEQTTEAIYSYLTIELNLLSEVLAKYQVTKLVGSSGAFDSYANIIHHKKTSFPLSKSIPSSHISLDEFNTLYNQIINSTRKNRLLIPGLDDIRVDTIVMAIIITNFTIKLANVNEILHSAYSLKEGVAAMKSVY